MKCFVHPLADVSPGASLGDDSKIWQFVVILHGAEIGSDCNICAHVLIEGNVHLGDRVTVKSGSQLWDGVRVGNDVFIGPNATFTNDPFPRSRDHSKPLESTVIKDGASIGANATILPGLTIGEKAMVGAGAVVTRSVPPRAMVIGNPARIVGYVSTEKIPDFSEVQASNNQTKVMPTLVKGVSLYEMPLVHDIRGSLSVGEFERTVPFSPKRYFTVFDVPSAETRGEHAHIKCKEFLVCVKGSCAVIADDGITREEYVLARPNLGLYLPEMTWTIQYKYSPDAVLMVLASDYYEADDYIREYDEFLRKKQP
ncbi:WxcM-like domain-containing protein [Frateuria hangzhouensis]|uniref:WxcM-like domain-containing protein n=1 Tax=Frateuria hangzhouensis TaxID=2995589 RepID=UPI002260B7DF|nr:WxcM-like domain-containing protein [Frateuria sp. STR12]MCX7513737.1 WxcM-like domain-containing protein [Frateuria sp. STR12]